MKDPGADHGKLDAGTYDVGETVLLFQLKTRKLRMHSTRQPF
jgi:hypothetical protein